jgi:hypothetical protein
METLAEKLAAGRALRKQTNRQSHREIGNVDRDPVKLLAASSAGRVKRLIPLRIGGISPIFRTIGSIREPALQMRCDQTLPSVSCLWALTWGCLR